MNRSIFQGVSLSILVGVECLAHCHFYGMKKVTRDFIRIGRNLLLMCELKLCQEVKYSRSFETDSSCVQRLCLDVNWHCQIYHYNIKEYKEILLINGEVLGTSREGEYLVILRAS